LEGPPFLGGFFRVYRLLSALPTNCN